jgi:hypothetical protein
MLAQDRTRWTSAGCAACLDSIISPTTLQTPRLRVSDGRAGEITRHMDPKRKES